MHLQVTESCMRGRWEAEGEKDGKLGGGMTEICGEEGRNDVETAYILDAQHMDAYMHANIPTHR